MKAAPLEESSTLWIPHAVAQEGYPQISQVTNTLWQSVIHCLNRTICCLYQAHRPSTLPHFPLHGHTVRGDTCIVSQADNLIATLFRKSALMDYPGRFSPSTF